MENDNRTEVVRIRLSLEEKRAIEAAAKKSGIPTSTWLRMKALELSHGDGK